MSYATVCFSTMNHMQKLLSLTYLKLTDDFEKDVFVDPLIDKILTLEKQD